MNLPLSQAARRGTVLLALAGVTASLPAMSLKQVKKTPEQLRQEYLDRIQQLPEAASARSSGSLWSPSAMLGDLSADYKAHTLHDSVTVLVSVQTSAAQSGNVNSQRNFSTNSGISGLVGGIATHGTNPLLTAQSATALKGQGQTSSNTAFSTSLTGEVIEVLPNGNLVIEAHRQVAMNNQHEDIVIRGVARPGDITPANIVASAALTNLEVEMKGKGIISDSVRPPNPLTRAVLWLFGF